LLLFRLRRPAQRNYCCQTVGAGCLTQQFESLRGRAGVSRRSPAGRAQLAALGACMVALALAALAVSFRSRARRRLDYSAMRLEAHPQGLLMGAE